jgi:hypothetical protein
MYSVINVVLYMQCYTALCSCVCVYVCLCMCVYVCVSSILRGLGPHVSYSTHAARHKGGSNKRHELTSLPVQPRAHCIRPGPNQSRRAVRILAADTPLAPVVERLCDARTLRLYRPSVSQQPRHPDSAASPPLFRRRRTEHSALPPAHTADPVSPHGGGTGPTPPNHCAITRRTPHCAARIARASLRRMLLLAARLHARPADPRRTRLPHTLSPAPSSCTNCRPRISAPRGDTEGANEAWGRIERYTPHEHADTRVQ